MVGERAGIPKSTFERRYKGRESFTTNDLDCLAHVLGMEAEELVDPNRWPEAS